MKFGGLRMIVTRLYKTRVAFQSRLESRKGLGMEALWDIVG